MDELPNEDFLFFADTLHVPYGVKKTEDVKRYIHQSIEIIVQEDLRLWSGCGHCLQHRYKSGYFRA
ncbi:Glutamate racemase 2 [compost metagenome]